MEPCRVEAGVGGRERVDGGAVGKGGAHLSSRGILSHLKNKTGKSLHEVFMKFNGYRKMKSIESSSELSPATHGL